MLTKTTTKVVLFLAVILTLLLIAPKSAYAAAITWDGGGTDGTCGGAAGDGNKWSCAANWSGDVVPTAADDVTFNSTSTKNATINTNSVVDSLTIAVGYTGTITQATGVTFDADQTGTAFSQADGTFTGGNSALSTSAGTFSLSGGVFTSTSGTFSIANSFTMTGGTFNHNSGTITINSNTGSTLTCGTATFNAVNFSKGVGSVSITVNSGCVIPLSGTNPSSTARVTNNGTINVTGNWTNNGYTQNSGAVLNMSGTTLTMSGDFTLNGGTLPSSVTTLSTTGDMILSGGSLPSSITTVSIGNGLTNNSNILPNGTALTINGTGGGSFACGTATFSSVVINRGASSVNVTVGSTCNFPLSGTNPVSVGRVINNGTISVTGNWTVSAYTQNSGAVLTATGTTFTVNGNLTLNGGTFPSSYTTLIVADDFSEASGVLPANVALSLTTTSIISITCGTPLASMTLNKNDVATVTFLSSCTVGDFTLTSGKIANPANTYVLTATGNVSSGSSVSIGGSNLTLTFSGTGTQTFSKTGTGTFATPITVEPVFKVGTCEKIS